MEFYLGTITEQVPRIPQFWQWLLDRYVMGGCDEGSGDGDGVGCDGHHVCGNVQCTCRNRHTGKTEQRARTGCVY